MNLKTKKIIAALAATSLSCSIISNIAFARQISDVNNDGKVNTIDALTVLKNVVGLDKTYEKNCDVNGDGNVDSSDALEILKEVVGINPPSGEAFESSSKTESSSQTESSSKTESSSTVTPPVTSTGKDWLHTDGSNIYDENGKEVWLTGVNWFGYNCSERVFHGLWSADLEVVVKDIADHGFNLIRVPFSAELINEWKEGVFKDINITAWASGDQGLNQSLLNEDGKTHKNSLEVFDAFLAACEKNGIKVMPDIHSAEADNSGHDKPMWYTAKYDTDYFYSALEWFADRYKDNDTIIAIDLKNEPHGQQNAGEGNFAKWNDEQANDNWKYVAETAAKKVLAKNPHLLIMIEGTEIYPIDTENNMDYHVENKPEAPAYYSNWWGGNLRGVKDFPVLPESSQIVYSPHDYGPLVFQQSWFYEGFTYETLIKDCWQDNWLYIETENIAPLLIGEWGGFIDNGPNEAWMKDLRKLIGTYHINHTFWCLNPNSGDTGGLLGNDWSTWDEEKYNLVKEVLWQEDGKFVGLDHDVPLGENGISLSQAKGLNG